MNKWSDHTYFADLVGKTIESVTGDESKAREFQIKCTDGTVYILEATYDCDMVLREITEYK
jgi:hypothetical protein